MNLQPYNSSPKESTLLNFSDLQLHFWNSWGVILCRVVELESIGDSQILQLYKKIHYANNLMNIQLYNSTAEKSTLVNFSDLQLHFWNWWCAILCRVVELESIGDSPTLQLYKKITMPITWWISNSTTLQQKNTP